MLIVVVVELVENEPPFGLVIEQVIASNAHPFGIGVSFTVYVWKFVMLLNNFVLAAVPSSSREKFASGDGEAVKGNGVDPLGVASLMIVIDPGKTTASAERDRSCDPPDPSRSTRAVWYGEPEIATAELFKPQSERDEIWPAQASTGLSWAAVNVIVICAVLSPAKPDPSGYEYALTAVIVPPYRVKTPGACVTPAPDTCGSTGIGNVVDDEHPLTPAHGSAVPTVLSKEVR
jgi:hypothetical protein